MSNMQSFFKKYIKVVIGRISKIVNSTFWAFGTLWLFIEISAFFSERFSNQIKPYWWLFLICGIAIGFIKAWPKTRVGSKIMNTDISIEIVVKDIFKLEGSIIVGINTTFDTSMENGIISDTSIQGQFTLKYFPSIAQLDIALDDALSNEECKAIPFPKAKGKQKLYNIGTVANIPFDGKMAYFVAISSLNKHYIAHASLQDIQDSLPKLWEHISTKGELEPIVMPVLGSRFSRINVKREQLIREIIKSFIAACMTKKFCEKLTIAISPMDFIEYDLDLIELGGFLKYACVYSTETSAGESSTSIGTPMPSP